MKLSKIFAYIFAAIALIFEGYFGIVPFVSFVAQIILLSFALFFLVWIFRRKIAAEWRSVIARYVLSILVTIGILTTFFLSFIGYQYLVPGFVSDITLSHTGQQIVFIEMSHIAMPEFYSSKKSKIAALAASGYTILVEGVRPGTHTNQAIFNQTLGFNFTPSLYETIADLIGLDSQDNTLLFAGIASGSLVSVDLSIDEIISIMGSGGQLPESTGSLIDLESQIRATTSILTQREQLFISWVSRSLLNWSLRRAGDIDSLLSSSSQSRLFETIIDRRNDAIVEYIQSHPKQNIAVVYGALHFNGVYASLQQLDPKWMITEIENHKPYSR